MNNKKDIGRAIDFHEVLVEKLKNPRFKKLYDEHGRQLELAYSLLQLRKKKKISQAALAAKIGTTQSNIARLESGRQNFTISFVSKVAEALGSSLKISFL
jgi:ribosome-binding protein aMBF1 (putative translation factor)